MNFLTNMAWMKAILLSCCVALTVGEGHTANALQPHPLRGAAFVSPDLQMNMPQKWLQQGLVHTPDAMDVDLVINMDQQFYAFLEPLMADYARKKGWKIKLIEGTCGTAEAMLRRKNLDIGGFCCPPSATDRLPGLRFHTLGLQSVAIVVNTANPVENVSLDQLRALFQGEIKNWQEIKTTAGELGANLPIRPVMRAHCYTRPGHWRLILDNKDLFGPRVADVGSIEDLLIEIANNPGAIGYEEMPTVRRSEQSSKIKAITIDGIGPENTAAVAAGQYPVYQVINLSVWETENTANPKALELVEYLKGHMEHLDPSSHFVPSTQLRKAGWKFTGPELTGEPQ